MVNASRINQMVVIQYQHKFDGGDCYVIDQACQSALQRRRVLAGVDVLNRLANFGIDLLQGRDKIIQKTFTDFCLLGYYRHHGNLTTVEKHDLAERRQLCIK